MHLFDVSQRVLVYPMKEITRLYKKLIFSKYEREYEDELRELFDALDENIINDVLTLEQQGILEIAFHKKMRGLK